MHTQLASASGSSKTDLHWDRVGRRRWLAVLTSLLAGASAALGQDVKMIGADLPSPGEEDPGGTVGDRSSPSCTAYQRDDGVINNALGYSDPGEFCWLVRFDALAGGERIESVSTIWGLNSLTPPNGTPAKVYVWEDPDDDGNPADAVLVAQTSVTVQNAGTRQFVEYALSAPAVVSGVFYVGASVAVLAAPNHYPAPMDSSIAAPGLSWYVFDSTALNPNDLMDNSSPVTDLMLGYPRIFMLRASGCPQVKVTYQGRLAQSGVGVNGAADLRFKLFDAAGGGTQVEGAIEKLGVAVDDGLFTQELGFGGGAFAGSPRWLEIEVAFPSGSSFVPLSPRQPVSWAPMAIHADSASRVSGTVAWSNLANVPLGFADGVDNGEYSLNASDGDPVNALFVDDIGKVGIGTTSPAAKLHVAGSVIVSGSIGNSSGALDFTSQGVRGMRIEYYYNERGAVDDHTINIVGGSDLNTLSPGVAGATIAGGGRRMTSGSNWVNLIHDDFGTIGGGYSNAAGKDDGDTNVQYAATVAGGAANIASGQYSAIGGGSGNVVYGLAGTVPGGASNSAGGDYSFAAGRRAKVRTAASSGDADGDEGCFIFADSTDVDFNSTGPDQFLIRAGGGVGIGTNAPAAPLHVAGGSDATVSGGGFFAAGSTTGNNIVIDDNEIMARANGAAAPLYLQVDGGDLVFGNATVGGRVGINANPAADLHVRSTGTTCEIRATPNAAENTSQIRLAENTSGSYGTILRHAGVGNKFQIFGVDAGTEVGPHMTVLRNSGFVGLNADAPVARLHLADDSIWITGTDSGGLGTAAGAGLRIFNSATDSSIFAYDYAAGGNRPLVLQNTGVGGGGKVGIARVPATNTLEVEGNASKTSSGSWLANSDARIKRDVATLDGALQSLDEIRLVRFRYTDEYRAAHPSVEDREYLNVIAQEFAQVFPNAVRPSGEKLADGSDILQVDTHPLTIYSAAAVQELHKMLRDRDAQVAERDRRIADLETRLARLERAISENGGPAGGRR